MTSLQKAKQAVISYRKAIPSDHPTLLELMRELVAELGASASTPEILDRLDGDIVTALKSQRCQFFLALDGEQPAGLSRADILDSDPIFRLRKSTLCGYVDQMYVRDEFRHQGVGQQLLGHCEDWFRSEGIEYSLLHASVAAVGFYARANYKPNREMFKRL